LFIAGGVPGALGGVWLTIVHLTAVAWAIYVELSPGIICPLTDLENSVSPKRQDCQPIQKISSRGISSRSFILRISHQRYNMHWQQLVVIVNLAAYRVGPGGVLN